MDKDVKKTVPDVSFYVKRLFFRQLLLGLLIALIVACLFPASLWALSLGLFAGLGDNLLVLRGIKQGMTKEVQPAIRHMRRTMIPRLGLLIIAVVLGKHLGLTAYSVLIGYIFLHMALLGNMIFLAKQNKP